MPSSPTKNTPIVLLLAAGLGTRLKPLTHCLPKCLMPIQGHPLLFYWLEQIKRLGIQGCYVNLHHHARRVKEAVSSSPYRDLVQFFEEPSLLGTAGTLRALYPHIRDRCVWLIHADNLSVTDWQAFITCYQETCGPGELLMQTFTTDHPQSCGIVELTPEGRVTAIHEKVENPPSCLANGAVYLLSPEIVQCVAQDTRLTDFSTQVLPQCLAQIRTWHMPGYHRDIGRISAFRLAQQELKISWKPQLSQAWEHWWQQSSFTAAWQQAINGCYSQFS